MDCNKWEPTITWKYTVLSAVGIASAFVIRLLGRSLLESHRVLRTFRKSYRRNLGTMCGWFLVRRVPTVEGICGRFSARTPKTVPREVQSR
jgi:hypothetical protein